MTLLPTRFLTVCIIVAALLTACNLQQQGEATPTLDASIQPPQTTITPAQVLPTLRPTPTSFALATAVPPSPFPGLPTVIPLGGGTPGLPGSGTVIPTLNPTDADQRYEITVKDGKTIGVNYVVTITSGTITMTLQGPDGVVWQKTLTASETSRAEVPIKLGGTYEILVQIDHFDGNYSVSWD
ncbi:MAG: hypothetical protein ABI690_02880 [Chloroflexota bacterium]